MMIIFRLFLYLICIISIGWSVLLFGGPPIIKRLISGYSDGALIPTGVTVSPRLGIGISLLEFDFQNEIAGWHIEGFSRAIEISWSLFGEKPFLEINRGPSVVKDHATADRVNFYTPSFQKIDWQNIGFFADINNLALTSQSMMSSLTVAGNINLGSAKLTNVNIEAEKFSVKNGSSKYSAHFIVGDLTELNLQVPLTAQLFSGTFVLENILVSEPNLTVPEAMIEISVEEQARNFKIGLHDVKFLEFGGSIENLKVDGHFNQFNVLQELKIVSTDSVPFKKSPKFPEILARIKKSGDEQYEVNIEGNLEEFELSDLDNFIGLMPGTNFVIDLEVDRGIPAVTSTSKIIFNNLSSTEISGFVEMGFSSKLLTNLGCAFWECEFTDFNLFYKINFDDEWIRGSAKCPNSFCGLAEMDHLLRTSNTIDVFTILNQANILSPLSSLFLFGAISSGQKINEGHELIFQF